MQSQPRALLAIGCLPSVERNSSLEPLACWRGALMCDRVCVRCLCVCRESVRVSRSTKGQWSDHAGRGA